MLKFFRRIRRKLFEEGNLKRYLLYATGEILLVVIGILIALQINTWNQSRLNKKVEKRILQDISDELLRQDFVTTSGKERMQAVITSASRLKENIRNTDSTIKVEDINEDIHKLTWIWISSNPTSIYDALIGSGDFGIISSPELRKTLTNLKHNQQLLGQFEEAQTRFVDQELRPFLNQTVDRTIIHSVQLEGAEFETHRYVSPFRYSHEDLLNNREFANLLEDLLFFTRRLIPPYERIEKDMARIDSLVNVLNPEIQVKDFVP